MARCAYCNTLILLGGVRNGERRFCNAKCQQQGMTLDVSNALPADLVEQQVRQLHQGQCPACQGAGPVDVHTSYFVWSALLLTSWQSKPHVCCRKCGIKKQAGDAVLSCLVGWWGFPWGLFITPVQIVRNVVAMSSPPSPAAPSPNLERLVRLAIASNLMAQAPPPAVPAPPPVNG